MAGLQSLLEDYRNWTKTQDWKLQKQREEMFGGDYELAEDIEGWGGGFNPSNIGSGLSGLAGAIKTYHMTPHTFDQFDLKKAKTGLGGMMHGRGIYTTDNPEGATDWIEQLPEKLQPKAKVLNVDLQWPDPTKELATPLSANDYPGYYELINDLPESLRDNIMELLNGRKTNLKHLGPLVKKFKLEQELAKRGVPGVKIPYGTESDYITFDPSYTKIKK